MPHLSKPPRLLAFSDQAQQSNSVSALCDLCEETQSGQVVVVLRDRELPLQRRRQMGESLCAAAERTGQLFVVSDRVDLALALGAAGVHLPASGFAPSDAKKTLERRDAWLSRSGHGAIDLADSELAALTALVISPVWQPRKGRPALGAAGLSQRVSLLRARAPALAIYALGGVSADNVRASLECGTDGVAAMGAIANAQERRRLLEGLGIRR